MDKFDRTCSQIMEDMKVNVDWKGIGDGILHRILDLPAYPYNKYQQMTKSHEPVRTEIPGGEMITPADVRYFSPSGAPSAPYEIKINRTFDLTKPGLEDPTRPSPEELEQMERETGIGRFSKETLVKAKSREPKTTKSALQSKPSRPRPPKRGVGFSSIRGADKK